MEASAEGPPALAYYQQPSQSHGQLPQEHGHGSAVTGLTSLLVDHWAEAAISDLLLRTSIRLTVADVLLERVQLTSERLQLCDTLGDLVPLFSDARKKLLTELDAV